MPRSHQPADARDVVAVLYDRLCLFEAGIVTELFGLERPELDVPWYRLQTCSCDPGPLRSSTGLVLHAPHDLSALAHAGTVVLPGWRDPHECPPEPLLHALRRAHRRGARLLSVCSGVFVLAWAGLLDGIRATTHWRYTEDLSNRFPRVTVVPDVLYVDEGSILTSAGSAAGIDLCLHLVRRDYGAAVANAVARRMVVPTHRDGGQAQFVPAPVLPEQGSPLAALLERVRETLDEGHTVASLAKAADMSERTFARRFREHTGTTPYRWLTWERVALAQTLLESTPRSLEEIARHVGFGSAQMLRHHFRERVGTSPSAFRRAFQAPA